jgi:hypothetical protein
MIIGKKHRFFGLLTVLFFGPFLWGEDVRTVPLDVYVIIDSSSAMEAGKAEAVSWLCNTLVEGILRDGDSLSVWTAGVKPELICSETVTSGGKEKIKTLIRSIGFSGNAADYLAALSQAQARSRTQPKDRLSYTLLINGSRSKDISAREAESAGLLIYSRVDNFNGWRIITVGLDIGAKVRDSAAAYMKNK